MPSRSSPNRTKQSSSSSATSDIPLQATQENPGHLSYLSFLPIKKVLRKDLVSGKRDSNPRCAWYYTRKILTPQPLKGAFGVARESFARSLHKTKSTTRFGVVDFILSGKRDSNLSFLFPMYQLVITNPCFKVPIL